MVELTSPGRVILTVVVSAIAIIILIIIIIVSIGQVQRAKIDGPANVPAPWTFVSNDSADTYPGTPPPRHRKVHDHWLSDSSSSF